MTLKRTAFLRKTPDAARLTVRLPATEKKPAKGPRTRKCKAAGCMQRVVPVEGSPVTWCSIDCGAAIALAAGAARKLKAARADRAAKKLEKAETKAKLEEHKPLSYWLKKAEAACNEYIRARDPDVCISCGVTYSSAWQAGHYIAVGANSTLRFNEDNIHKQCIQCNMFKGSNATPYRIGLLEKLGAERVEWLESWHAPVKMTRAAAEEVTAHYRAKLRALTKNT